MIRSSIMQCAVPLMLTAAPAFADPLIAESCAKNLSPPALRIYRAAEPAVKPDSDLRALLRAKVMPMVLSGDMNRRTAQPAATEASFCLRNLQR